MQGARCQQCKVPTSATAGCVASHLSLCVSQLYTPKGGPFKYPTPRPLEVSEIKEIIKQYADAARNAIEAGFDGIEVGRAQ